MSAPAIRCVVIDYGAGNLRSAHKALVRAAEGLNATVEIVRDAAALANATHVVLPGVGAFADCMAGLRAMDGMVAAMEQHALRDGKPFLGICVGMQLLFEQGLEHGTHAGLGWFKGQVARLDAASHGLKVPHMGWNELEIQTPHHPLFAGLPESAHMYFVHSYAATHALPQETLATTQYGATIIAAIGRENIVATQFHPEKSQEAGLCLLRNFLSMSSCPPSALKP